MTPQAQHPATSVGDTLTIVHRIPAPPGAMVQPRLPTDSSLVTVIGLPNVTREGDSVRIAYAVAVWAPGRNQLLIPGPVVVTLSGRVDTLPDARVELDVTSVLPAGTQPAKLPPKPAHPWVARADRSALPFAVLLPLALLAIGALHWWWRRRGPPRPAAVSPTAPALDAARLERWLAAGEPRLALEHLAWSTRGRPEVDDWRARAEAERFAAGDDAGLDALVREGWARATEESP